MILTLFATINILVLHFIADFVFQSDWMAINKSSSFRALLLHVVIYTLTLCTIPLAVTDMSIAVPCLTWALVNGVIHFVQDAVTSRMTAYLWKKEQRHWFFVVIGLDQLLHYVFLFWLWSAMVEG